MAGASPHCSPPDAVLDLRGTPCPLNFIRTKLALEKLEVGGCLQVDLDGGEPELMVSEGLRAEGHGVTTGPHPQLCGVVRLWIQRHG